MEPARIDWETIDSVFTIDDVFEDINAPQWVDFLAPPDSPYDDVSWFCRPECNHPRTPEDFHNSSPVSKLLRSVSVSKLFADWTPRDPMYLERGGKVNENKHPNYSAPLNYENNHDYEEVIKSSAEKGGDYYEINLERSDEQPRLLKGPRSAEELFGGGDFFGKITEFCNELKKIASTRKTYGREVKDEEEEEERFETPKAELNTKQQLFKDLGPKEVNERDEEMKPSIEVKLDAAEKSNGKGKLRRKQMKGEDAEDNPVSLDLKKVKREENISHIRTNPPTPQGFSETCNPVLFTPSKGTKSRFMEIDIIQELQLNTMLREELDEMRDNENAPLIAAEDRRTLDVFWFLKPCSSDGSRIYFKWGEN